MSMQTWHSKHMLREHAPPRSILGVPPARLAEALPHDVAELGAAGAGHGGRPARAAGRGRAAARVERAADRALDAASAGIYERRDGLQRHGASRSRPRHMAAQALLTLTACV